MRIKILVIVTILAILAIIASYIFSELISIQGNLIRSVFIRDVPVKAEVVSCAKKIELGLGGRKNLPEGRGMLFAMPGNQVQRFWMKGMRFPIDIIWIANGQVIGCERNISADDTRIFTSPDSSNFVLEVPAGFCDRYGVQSYDDVRI